MTSPTAYVLSRSVLPTHYDLRLAPDLDRYTFDGELTVSLAIAEPVSTITLHAAELDVSSAVVALPGGEQVAGVPAVDEEAESLTIAFDRELPPGEAALRLRFAGTLNDQLRGFYRSQYRDADGATRTLAATQFEATDARRAFPCWDEPAIKASFDVTLVIPDGFAAISNMPAAGETQTDGKRVVRFQTTPRMSTYYLAFLVGDFAAVETTDDAGVLHRVFATRGKKEYGRFALEHSVRILRYMNDYFGVPYPLPKVDHVAVPDFAAGAMENWGCITYRETALLFHSANSAAQARQRILEVVAHEMAHMWFGDLVTMEWWDDLWLNESFASWLGDKTVDHLYPEWAMWTQFVSNSTNEALALDGLRNSHPIEQQVNDPAEIRELFDAISYSKGGSVLRMLEDWLGPERFRQGLRDYVSAHAYGNARGADLWQALERASGLPAIAVANSWVKQTGYPVLDAQIDRAPNATAVRLHQSRFLYDHLLGAENRGEEGEGGVWKVPVSVADGSGGRASLLMEQANGAVETAPGVPWIKVNAGQTGFFRVNYDPGEWERLRRAVANRELDPTDRLGLQNDAYALMRAGRLPATVFLPLARAYDNEPDAIVLADLASNLRGLHTLLWDDPSADAFEAFARDRFAPAAARAGWDAKEGEGHLDTLFRATALSQAGVYGNPPVVAEAQRRFAAFADTGAPLHPDIRSVAFNLAAQEGGKLVYDTLWGAYHDADMHEERVRLLRALAQVRRPDLLSDLLDKAMDPDVVRAQDTVIVLIQASMNRRGRDMVWAFIEANWAELDRRYGKGGFAIMRLVETAGRFTTSARAQEVEAFFAAHPAPSAARTLQQALERIRLNERWLARNAAPIGEWLAAR